MSFDLADTVFTCIDIQPREPRSWNAESILPEWKEEGFTLEELNAAERHFQEVVVPNAVKVADWARARGLPRIFVHWAGEGAGHRPHGKFELTPEDHVVPKTEMNAFPSSNFGEILEKLGRRTLLMIGGHTQGCLGRTARNALELGYRCVLVRDASYDCSILRWPKGIAAVAYDLILETEDTLKL
jgi:nicotinamidase-related amidase